MDERYIEDADEDKIDKLVTERLKTRSEKERYRHKVFFLFVLMMLDYIVTYLGVNQLGIIEEANPLLVWLFEISFLYGFSIRLIYVTGMCWLCMFIYNSGYKYRHHFINFALAVNAIVAFIHIKWMILVLMGVL